MKKNIGALDRLLRIITAIIFFILAITVAPNIVVRIILGFFSLALFATGISAICPIYIALKISTKIYKK